MDVRYVFNTRGEYAAFVAGGHLFTPDCDWLGVIRAGETFNTQGAFVGTLLPDDRLVRDRSSQLPRQILRPATPLRPVRPLPPRRRLFMTPFTFPRVDVFQGTRRPLTSLVPLSELMRIETLSGHALVAADGCFLGRISGDPGDGDSLADASGPFGDPFAPASIFNPSGPYGSPDSPLSPFHPASATPPRILRGEEPVGVLSVNAGFPDRVDPNALLSWLAAP